MLLNFLDLVLCEQCYICKQHFLSKMPLFIHYFYLLLNITIIIIIIIIIIIGSNTLSPLVLFPLHEVYVTCTCTCMLCIVP